MRYFVVSDIHGFYDEFMDALKKSRFDRDNTNHTLVCLGDYFDRGNKPFDVMNFLTQLERKVLVRGNHDVLLQDMCEREYPDAYDSINRTWQTAKSLCKVRDGTLFQSVANMTRPFYNSMVNYFETKYYIFVHGHLPTPKVDGIEIDWRDATEEEWERAMWKNGFDEEKKRIVSPSDKTIVFGHWHTSYARHYFDGTTSEFGPDACFDPYYGDRYIGIDACTAHSHQVNIIEIEDEPL